MVEPLVQGAGGMIFHDAEVLRRCAPPPTAGLLLIFDEIFTGFGRTGRCSPARRPAWRPTSSPSSRG